MDTPNQITVNGDMNNKKQKLHNGQTKKSQWTHEQYQTKTNQKKTAINKSGSGLNIKMSKW